MPTLNVLAAIRGCSLVDPFVASLDPFTEGVDPRATIEVGDSVVGKSLRFVYSICLRKRNATAWSLAINRKDISLEGSREVA
jgi:hypothetical protein